MAEGLHPLPTGNQEPAQLMECGQLISFCEPPPDLEAMTGQ